jgi:hypothetical protein
MQIGVAQGVERLFCKHEALSSNPHYTKKQTNKQKRAANLLT